MSDAETSKPNKLRTSIEVPLLIATSILSVMTPISTMVAAYYYTPLMQRELAIYTRVNSVELKQVDVEMHCNTRWADPFKERREIERSFEDKNARVSSSTVAEYYRQFWSLQHDQFNYFEQGAIPTKIFVEWMHYRYDEFQRNEPVGNVKFDDAWRLYGASIASPSTSPSHDFNQLITHIRDIALRHETFDYALIEKDLERYRNRYPKEAI